MVSERSKIDEFRRRLEWYSRKLTRDLRTSEEFGDTAVSYRQGCASTMIDVLNIWRATFRKDMDEEETEI